MNGQEITLQTSTSGMPSDCKGCHTCKLFDKQHKAQEKQTSIKDHSNNCPEHSGEKKRLLNS